MNNLRFAADNRVNYLSNSNSKLKREISTLRSNKSTARYVTHNGQRKTINEVVQETSDRIARRVAVDASRNVATAPAEAIPYIGAGAIVAVTSWELYDACETMKDLHSMNLAFNPDADDAEATTVCSIKVPTTDELVESVKNAPGRSWDKAKEWASNTPDLPDFPSWSDFSVASKEKWGNFKDKVKNWVSSD